MQCDPKATFPILIRTTFGVYHHSFDPVLHLEIVILNHLDKVGI